MPFSDCTSPGSRAIEIVSAIGNNKRHNEFKSRAKREGEGRLGVGRPHGRRMPGAGRVQTWSPSQARDRKNRVEGWEREQEREGGNKGRKTQRQRFRDRVEGR